MVLAFLILDLWGFSRRIEYHLQTLLVVILFSAPFFIFASELPKRKKVIWMWLSVIMYCIGIFFYTSFNCMPGESGETCFGAVWAAGLLVAVVVAILLSIIVCILWFLLRFDASGNTVAHKK